MLHGAIGSATQFEPLKAMLADSFNILAPNFPGHGGDQFPDGPFSIKAFAEYTADFIEASGIHEPVDIFGYSMGGYVAMYMARHMEVNIRSIITLGTKFQWDESIAARECRMLQPDTIEQKVPAFAKQLQERHQPTQWKRVLNQTAAMLQEMGKANPLQPADYTYINIPCLLMLGDRDKMVSREETINVYQQLPNAQLAILPGTPHPLEQVDQKLLAYHLPYFLQHQHNG
jgi:pimeloyl-ACP methyl ester carboxylesterase